MKKITRLTKQQESQFKPWAKKWIDHGLSIERADWDRFEKAARECYAYANLNSSIPIIHVPSPIVGAFAAPIAALTIASLKKDVKTSAVDSGVGSAVYSAVGSAVYSGVGSAVGSGVGSGVRSGKDLFWHYWFGGSLWQGWNAWVSFFTDVCELDLGDVNKRAKAYAETSLSAGYWWPNKDFIMVCDRPTEINRDGSGRLHSENGMAIRWIDGWGLWMWHGTKVSEKIIMRSQEITREEILAESNSEVSRAIAEKIGWAEYLKRVDAVLIDKWFDPNKSLHYELYDFKERRFSLMPRLLKMESPELNDGSRPYYIEPVDPGLKTCQAARKWQFMKEDLTWPTVEDCNKNPNMVFEVEA